MDCNKLLILGCLFMVSCLDPFVEKRECIVDDYYLLRGDERRTTFCRLDRNSITTLLENEIVEAIYLDSVIYLKGITNLNTIDTTYYIYHIDTSLEPSVSSRVLYEAVRSEITTIKGKIVEGYH